MAKSMSRDTRWEMRIKEASEHIKDNWPGACPASSPLADGQLHCRRTGASWIVEMVTDTMTRKGKRDRQAHYFLTTLRTKPEALLRLIRQRWSIENEWHWVRDTQLGEDAHRYANRTGAALFSFLRTVAMNLLRGGGYRSVHAGQQALSHDIKGLLALGKVAASTA